MVAHRPQITLSSGPVAVQALIRRTFQPPGRHRAVLYRMDRGRPWAGFNGPDLNPAHLRWRRVVPQPDQRPAQP